MTTNKYATLRGTIARAKRNDCQKVVMHVTLVEEVLDQLSKDEKQVAALAAENGQILRLLTDISENHDEYVNQDEYLYAGVPMDYVSEINAYVSRDVEAENPFKETDAFLAEVRASAIPDGYVLVPQEMHLSSEAMEGICFHCGDGGFAFGEFTDGLLFVGAIDDSDGQKIHGLHIATADYPEEGCATICAFLPAPTEGAAQ
ncbi:hypothetical protein IM316_22000 [Enterobacter cloacae complex sp. S4]|uniref:hypothetical protein n=1 Tax=Enterobacter cloacae complex TaxID=354276 RepID=UPI00187289D1|nr:hypothetical protein [Enterobacter cloacae complex sp. S4]MBE4870012.1 hypothetical protein [Enterobacter cloacae complex sp. S4]